MPRASIIAVATLIAASGVSHGAIISSSAENDAKVTQSVNDFRAALGNLNPNTPQSFDGGRREINWDAVPDTAASPNALPGDFFNGAVSPRARGAVFATPGAGFQVSANAGNAASTPTNFGNLDPSYVEQFRAFSPQRLFTAIGSNVTEVKFFLPGTNTPAAVSAFGAVFTDVDLANSSKIAFYDANDTLLHSEFVPASGAGTQGFSFLGVQFTGGELISRIVITSGTNALGGGVVDDPARGIDLVAMDDFIYAEPHAVPAPGASALLAAGGLLLARRRR